MNRHVMKLIPFIKRITLRYAARLLVQNDLYDEFFFTCLPQTGGKHCKELGSDFMVIRKVSPAYVQTVSVTEKEV